MALKADISQESLTLAATWILGEYSEIIVQGGVVDDEQTIMVSLLINYSLLWCSIFFLLTPIDH